MKKIRMMQANSLTLEEGYNKYLDNCRARNLREGTINHYKQSYTQFYKYFGKEMLVVKSPYCVFFRSQFALFKNESISVSIAVSAGVIFFPFSVWAKAYAISSKPALMML